MTVRSVSFPALGTTAVLVVANPSALRPALEVLRAELAAIDAAASRFRPDSEIAALNGGGGKAVRVSPLMLEAVEASLRAARATDGLVDPTVGRALRMAGYDRDFGILEPEGPPLAVVFEAVPGWSAVQVDPARSTVAVPSGVELDLGATAKALSADRSARAASALTGAGVLVSLGGDIAVAGRPPPDGWVVEIDDGPPTAVSIQSGGFATSSTTVRRWVRGGVTMHHLIDPKTGAPAVERWRTVSVAAGSCLDANIASTAAILLGEDAPAWLAERALPARLVDPAGNVTTAAGWPEEPLAPGPHVCRAA